MLLNEIKNFKILETFWKHNVYSFRILKAAKDSYVDI